MSINNEEQVMKELTFEWSIIHSEQYPMLLAIGKTEKDAKQRLAENMDYYEKVLKTVQKK